MSLQDRLKGRTAGLGLSPTVPASTGQSDAGIPPAGAMAETDTPTRARTGPGRMFHMQQIAGDKDERIAALEERVKQFDGAMAARAVDPKTIGFSDYANRHEEEFSSPEFQELVEEIRSAGRNIQPIMVRRVKGKGRVPFEVIYGHRRLRACQMAGCQVWIVEVEASDEELFVFMDRENRSRKNPSAFELGDSYRRALEARLFPSLNVLSQKLGVDLGNASKAYKIATLPADVLAAFPRLTEIQYRWSKPLSDALQNDPDAVLAIARRITGEGRDRSAAQVYEQLIGKLKGTPASLEVRKAGVDKPVALIARADNGAVTIKISAGCVAPERLANLHKLIEGFLRD